MTLNALTLNDNSAFEPTPAMWRFVNAHADENVEPTITAICAAAGISRTAYYGWRKQPAFVAFVHQEAQAVARERLDRVYSVLYAKAMRGDTGAIKVFLDRFDPDYVRGAEKQDARRIRTHARFLQELLSGMEIAPPYGPEPIQAQLSDGSDTQTSGPDLRVDVEITDGSGGDDKG